MWPFSKKPEPVKETPPRHWLDGAFSTSPKRPEHWRAVIDSFSEALELNKPRVKVAMDAGDGTTPTFKVPQSALPDELLGWYASQRFIGYQTCGMLSQQWLIDKACTMPARDAIRHGFDLGAYGDAGYEVTTEQQNDITERIRRADKSYRLFYNMLQFVRMGRIFGIRVAFFKVDSTDEKYYEKPFNIDGVTPGSYRGIVQVDPYWCIPLLSGEAASDPASMHFYEPEWWVIGGKRYHRSHLCIFRNGELPDVLKPMYSYGGVPVPQQIMERVYAAERTANEGPQLAMTKRLVVQKTDLGEAAASEDAFIAYNEMAARFRDNYGTKFIAQEDEVSQLDTSLNDLDAVIMTQYQIVAAAAGVPATKLLGTTPKGFNSSGDYEADSYHEELETIQANDLTDFVNRHHQLVMRSQVEPALELPKGAVRVEIDWLPVDSPTAKEYAEINKLNADTDAVLVGVGAVDAMEVRTRLRGDNNSNYADLAEIEDPTELMGEEPDDGSEEDTAIPEA